MKKYVLLPLALMSTVVLADAGLYPSFLQHALDLISSITGNPIFVVVASGTLEMIFRLVKTSKPLSIAHLVAYSFQGLGKLFLTIGDSLDKLLPQNVS